MIIKPNVGVVDVNAPMLEVVFKQKNARHVYVLDGAKLIGVIGNKEMQNVFTDLHNNQQNIQDMTAKDICNKDFKYTTFRTISDDLGGGHRIKVFSLPVIDDQGNLLHIIYANALKNLNNWNNAQSFEMDWWKKNLSHSLLNNYDYSNLLHKIPSIHEIIVNCWKGKTCLEIGAGPLCGYLPRMIEAKRRIIVEPLAEKYDSLRSELSIDISGIEDIEFYPKPADYYISELKNAINGLIISRNALDHTPNWCFILSNISLYAQKGSYFYLWTDILHTSADPIGHFNITPDVNQFLRLIESFGFKILYSEINNSNELRPKLCVTIFSVKR